MIQRTSKEHVLKILDKNQNKWNILDIGCNIAAVEYAQTVADIKDFSKFRWAVDEIEDLNLVKEIIRRIKKTPIFTEDIIKLLDSEPQLRKINQSISNEEGYSRSLKNDENFLQEK